ncbi:PKD domain-containing protein [[Eubacterium] cellulosolvens]
MSSKLVKKTVCLLVIMAMVLTTLSVIPIGFAGSRNPIETRSIDGTVVYTTTQGIYVIPGATVILYNLHTGERFDNTSDINGFFIFNNVPPGHYQLIAKPPKDNYLSINTSKSDIIEVDEEDIIGEKLYLEKIPDKPEPIYQVNGTIYDEFSVVVANATVTLKSLDYPGYSVTSALTNETGQYIVKAYRGSYELWATAPEFQYYIKPLSLNTPIIMDYDIILNSSMSVISGDISFDKSPGNVLRDVFLYDIDNDEFIHETFSGYIFQVKAYHGNFGLIIDVPGFKPYYHPSIIQLNDNQNSYQVPANSIKLEKTNDEKIVTTISFKNNNWNNLHFKTTWTLNHDSELFGLEYVDYGDPITIGCPRFQVDMERAFGGISDGIINGTVEAGEVTELNAWLKKRGPYNMYTEDVFEINDTHFGWKKTTFAVATAGFVGGYGSTSSMVITTDLDYRHFPTSEPLASTAYKIRFDHFRPNEVRVINLPAGFEISKVKSYDIDKVWVRAFNKCQVNDTVTIYVEKVKAPQAYFEITDDFDVPMDEPYVDVLVNLTFNATKSNPGSGVINNYTWNLDNGKFGYGEVFTYNYTDPGIYNVTLSILTTASQSHKSWVDVTIDNTPPKGVIELQNETGVKITDGLENTQDDDYFITFNASKSWDTIDGVIKGKIKSYYWELEGATPTTGTGVVSNHSFEYPGTFHYNLTVTDYAGHTTIVEKDIVIKDIEPPIPSMKTEPPNRVCDIDKWIILNGSISTDNFDETQNLTFWWDLDIYTDSNGDGFLENDNDADGPIYNLTPVRTGPQVVALWVKDTSNNVGNSTEQPTENWQIDVIGPNLRLAPVHEEINKFIEVSKKDPTEGDKVTFTVNVTNENEVTAWDVLVRLIIDGKEKSTKSIKKLGEDEWEIVKFKWEAESPDKSHNITINATLEYNESYEQFWDNNQRTIVIKVKQSVPIDTNCLIVIIIIIIIILIVVAYFYRRRRQEKEFMSRREKGKGKKKEKQKARDKTKKKKGK